jgi:hypothetical protein
LKNKVGQLHASAIILTGLLLTQVIHIAGDSATQVAHGKVHYYYVTYKIAIVNAIMKSFLFIVFYV